MATDYWSNMATETDRVFRSHPVLFDHRSAYPWLTGVLGDPFAGIWFLAENPSLKQVEIVRNPDGGEPTIEAQWWSSRGDKLFREMLVKYGFKQGEIDTLGGWNCYISNVIKEADYTNRVREKTQTVRNRNAEVWGSLLEWELEHSKPRLVVTMGLQTEKLLQHLVSSRIVKLPRTEKITHYAYIGQRAKGHLGPMHPLRIQEYDREFARIQRIFNSIR